MAVVVPVPAEIDLFSGPHSRMKELVNKYSLKVQHVDYRNCQEVCSMLKELQTTLREFKSHEYIENMFIMDQLKNRLKQNHIYNSAVCDCHNDNRLQEILKLVKNGRHLWKTTIGERLHYGFELQKAFTEFVQMFLPHMEEEENIFQPLLVEHFDYDELKVLKEVVLEQHELIKDPLHQEKADLDTPETDSAIKELRDLDSNECCLSSLYTEELDEESTLLDSSDTLDYCDYFKNQHSTPLAPDLPIEIIVNILQYLEPPDRGRCAQISSVWNRVVYSPILWKEIYPVQWARGFWEAHDLKLSFMLEDEINKGNLNKIDEDADVDESEILLDSISQKESLFFQSLLESFLPRIGSGVEKLVLDGGQGISPRLLHQTLMYCPNVTHLSATYTFFDYYTFKSLWKQDCLNILQFLDLEGCEFMDDNGLLELSCCLKPRVQTQANSLQYLRNMCRNSYIGNVGFTIECPCRRFCSKSTGPFSMVQNICPGNNDFTLIRDEIEELYCCQSNFQQTTYGNCPMQREESIEPTLKFINLSGCWRLTNSGLMALVNSGCLKSIVSLNLSSCFHLSGETLLNIAAKCPKLNPESLTYCSNILNGPYLTQANGCDSICHPLKVCCRNSGNYKN